MCRRFPYMAMPWGELVPQLAELPHEAIAAVTLLIGKTWERGDPFRDDDHLLARVTGFTLRTWRRKIRPAIEGLFDLADGFWRHPLIERARAHAEGRAPVRRHAKSRFVRKNRSNFNDPPSQKRENQRTLFPKEGEIERTRRRARDRPRPIRNRNRASTKPAPIRRNGLGRTAAQLPRAGRQARPMSLLPSRED